jgi:thiol-disulfide isomerase/thioredoxin
MRTTLIIITLLCARPLTAQVIDLTGKGIVIKLPRVVQVPKEPVPVPPVPPVPPVTEDPEVTVCQCKGSNRKVCLCLKANVKCGCSPVRGSEWTKNPLKKTGRYFNPGAGIEKQKKQPPTYSSYETYIDQYNRLSWDVDGVQWFFDPGERVQNGYRDGKWYYSHGMMYDTTREVAPLVDPNNCDAPLLPIARRALLFSASWCTPCQRVRANVIPALQEMGYRFGLGDNLHVQVVDTDSNPELTSRYRVTGIPCLVVLENGKEVDRVTGEFSKADFLNAFRGD